MLTNGNINSCCVLNCGENSQPHFPSVSCVNRIYCLELKEPTFNKRLNFLNNNFTPCLTLFRFDCPENHFVKCINDQLIMAVSQSGRRC